MSKAKCLAYQPYHGNAYYVWFTCLVCFILILVANLDQFLSFLFVEQANGKISWGGMYSMDTRGANPLEFLGVCPFTTNFIYHIRTLLIFIQLLLSLVLLTLCSTQSTTLNSLFLGFSYHIVAWYRRGIYVSVLWIAIWFLLQVAFLCQNLVMLFRFHCYYLGGWQHDLYW